MHEDGATHVQSANGTHTQNLFVEGLEDHFQEGHERYLRWRYLADDCTQRYEHCCGREVAL